MQLAKYLHKLKNDGKAYATICAHKAAICRTLVSMSKENLGTHSVIRDLLKRYKNNIRKTDHTVPDWNFTVVLRALSRAPFEPLNEVNMKYLTMKVLFLTMWASATRCSEIHALSIEDGHYLQDTHNRHIDLVPNTKFLAKNQLATDPPRRYRIKAIKGLVPSSSSEALLCPVRALRTYVNRTKDARKSCKQLFVNLKRTAGMAKHSVSYWLKKCIITAYEVSEPHMLSTLHRVTPHEIRAVATTLAVNKHIPVKGIMRKAYWKTDTSFTSHYFKNIAKYVKDDVGIDTSAAGYRLQI